MCDRSIIKYVASSNSTFITGDVDSSVCTPRSEETMLDDNKSYDSNDPSSKNDNSLTIATS